MEDADPAGVPAGWAEELRRSAFGRTVADLSARHRLPCRVRLNRRASALPGAVTNVVTRRIVIDRAVLAEDDEGQAWTAAHEVGHLVDSRAMGLRRYLPWRFFGWLLVGLAAIVGTVPLANLLPVEQLPLAPRLGIALAVLAVGLVTLAGCAHLALLRRAAHQGPLEDAADEFARSQGYPVTAAIADMLDRQERTRNGQPPNRRWHRYRAHRYPAERINAS